MNQTEWVVPCNPNNYDIEAAFMDNDEVYWRQNANYQIGDIVYIYLSKGINAIRYKTIVIEKDITIRSEDDPYWLDRAMQSVKLRKVLLKRIRTFDDARFSYDMLKANGLKSTIQGPQKLKDELRNYLHSIECL